MALFDERERSLARDILQVGAIHLSTPFYIKIFFWNMSGHF